MTSTSSGWVSISHREEDGEDLGVELADVEDVRDLLDLTVGDHEPEVAPGERSHTEGF